MASGDGDAQLVVRAAAGDDAALDALYRRHAAAALRAARAVSGNDADAEDARSDAFAGVLEALRHQRVPSDRFRPYLMAAARHAAIDAVRRSARTWPTDRQEELDRPVEGDDAEERLTRAVDIDLVRQAFRALPARWQTVLLLVEVDGRPLREAARALGLSNNGAAQLAVRARAGLRRRFLGSSDAAARRTVQTAPGAAGTPGDRPLGRR